MLERCLEVHSEHLVEWYKKFYVFGEKNVKV